MDSARSEDPVLAVDGLVRRFGGILAVDNISFKVPRGSITALIGPNGAGKTTTLNVISGIIPPTSGSIALMGEDITSLRPHEICRRGMARTFQTPQIFRSMTVRENLLVGTTRLGHISLLAAALRLPGLQQEEEALRSGIEEWLKWVELESCADQSVATLSFGQIRMVEIARVLAGKPCIILMDEPASGLSRAETQALRSILFRIRALGISVLLVEHNMSFVMSTVDDVVVFDRGHFLAAGNPDSIQANKAVREAYLGRVE